MQVRDIYQLLAGPTAAKCLKLSNCRKQMIFIHILHVVLE